MRGRGAAALALAGALFTTAAAAAPPPALIPYPAELKTAVGAFRLADGARVAAPAGDTGALAAARAFADAALRLRGLHLSVVEGGAGEIVFARGKRTPAEGYALDVTPTGARVTASDDAGLYHGAMTLAQLASPDGGTGAVSIPAMAVKDAPRFAWRGVMLDVARHFQPLDSIRAVIDQMALHKLNVLHLHLSDDQGWRLEIKRYPKLTEVGGWRTPPTAGGPPSTERVGGFYTQAEMRALVAYAAARHVTIVPEIDLPGHAQAAVAAYPEAGVFGDRPQVSTDWGVNPYLFGTSDAAVAFIDNVLDEVTDVFPSTFVHLGGDEAIKDQWARSPAVQAKMAALGIKTEDAMQSWLMERLAKRLAAKGRRMIGWDEILQGGLPPSASVMSWRGEQGAIDAANAGHDVVLSPAPTLYLDNLQSRAGDEQPGRLAIVTLKDVYAYDPMPKAIAADKAGHVLGVQANAWSEYIVTPAELQHALLPRLDALSEIAWSPKAARDWPGFVARLQPQMARYRREGLNAADSAFAVALSPVGGTSAAARAGHATVEMATQVAGLPIRYTLDGSAPSAASRLYAGPVDAPAGAVVRAAAFGSDGRSLSAPRALDTSRAAMMSLDSAQLSACPKSEMGLRVPLTPDATATSPAIDVDIFDTCAVYPKAPLDLAAAIEVRFARLARNYGLAHDFDKVKSRYNATRFGELVVRAGGCEGAPVATFPLPDPMTSERLTTVRAALPAGLKGDADLCLTFTAPISGPFYAVDRVSLVPKSEGAAR